MKQKRASIGIIMIAILMFSFLLVGNSASGEVQQITEVKQELEGITQEEIEVLKELFTISQEISEIENEIKQISDEIETTQQQVDEYQDKIDKKQEDYNLQLNILKQVLIGYQRGGPASYLEILLQADNFTSFLKSINIIKDISRNIGELLTSLEEGRKELEAQKEKLAELVHNLELKKEELIEPLQKKQELKEKQENYLESLQDKKESYRKQLTSLETMWEDSKSLFSDIVDEITRIVGEGYLTMDDLNLTFGFTKMEGVLFEDSLNEILSQYANLTNVIFHFHDEQIVLEVPDNHLVLTGTFIIEGETGMRFQVENGTFYDLPLEESSLAELFRDGPLVIDFKELAGDMLEVDFTLQKIEVQEGYLEFIVKPNFNFGF